MRQEDPECCETVISIGHTDGPPNMGDERGSLQVFGVSDAHIIDFTKMAKLKQLEPPITVSLLGDLDTYSDCKQFKQCLQYVWGYSERHRLLNPKDRFHRVVRVTRGSKKHTFMQADQLEQLVTYFQACNQSKEIATLCIESPCLRTILSGTDKISVMFTVNSDQRDLKAERLRLLQVSKRIQEKPGDLAIISADRDLKREVLRKLRAKNEQIQSQIQSVKPLKTSVDVPIVSVKEVQALYDEAMKLDVKASKNEEKIAVIENQRNQREIRYKRHYLDKIAQQTQSVQQLIQANRVGCETERRLVKDRCQSAIQSQVAFDMNRLRKVSKLHSMQNEIEKQAQQREELHKQKVDREMQQRFEVKEMIDRDRISHEVELKDIKDKYCALISAQDQKLSQLQTKLQSDRKTQDCSIRDSRKPLHQLYIQIQENDKAIEGYLRDPTGRLLQSVPEGNRPRLEIERLRHTKREILSQRQQMRRPQTARV